MAFDKTKYLNKYQKENYDRIELKVKKGKKEELKKYAENKGMKMNEYIKDILKKETGIEF